MLEIKMSDDDLRSMRIISREMVKPQLKLILDLPEEKIRKEIIKLTMALGFGIAVLAEQFFGEKTTPEEYGAQMGRYIASAIDKLRETRDEHTAATEKKSSWNITS